MKKNTVMRHIANVAVTVVAISIATELQAKPKLDGKIVLANVDRYQASFRVGKIQKQIAPRKASVLNPKKYPLALEIWNGIKGRPGWDKVEIKEAGTYVFRFQGGRWNLTKHSPRVGTGNALTKSTPRRPTYARRSTGSRARVVQRGGGSRVSGRRRTGSGALSTIERGMLAAASIYRFVRDEQDRELIRRLIVDREIDDRVRREIEDRIRDKIWDDAVNLPVDDRRELERAWDELERIKDSDWKEAVNLPAEDWDDLRERIGDEIGDADWAEIQKEIGEIGDNIDISTNDIESLDEAGIEDLEQAVDLGDLDETEVGDFVEDWDVGDFALDSEDLDVGDLGFGDVDGGWNDGGGWDSYDYGGGFEWGGDDWGGDDWGGDDWGGDDWGGDFDFDW